MQEGTGLQCELKHLETLDEAFEFMRWLGERRPILGADTETGGLRWWDEELRLVQFGDARTGWVISYRDWRGLIEQALSAYDREMVFHNVGFDAKWMLREGLTVKRHLIHDTLPMSHLLDPPGTHALKPLSEELIDPYAHAGAIALHEGMRKQKWTWATVPVTFAPYIWYSALDGVLVARMWEILEPQVRAAFQANYELEMSNIWADVDASMRGMRIDAPYARREQARLLERSAEIKAEVSETYGFSVGSNEAVTAQLVADGLPLEAKTKAGRWKLDKDVLDTFSGQHPLIDMVTEYKQGIKFSRAYYGGVLDRLDPGPDGDILHPDINPLGARTSRESVSNPAVQQIPSRDPRPRRMFIPREGNALVSGDLSNIEPRIMAHLSAEPTMLAAFQRGEDVHMFMAQHMYPELAGFSPDTAAPNYSPAAAKGRKKSKSGSLGKMYGIGISKFALQQGVPEHEARAFMEFYDATFPGIPAFILDVQEVAEERYQKEGRAYVRDPSGRVHTLRRDEARDGRFYALVNFIIQGWAATLLKRAKVRFTQTEFGHTFVMPVHDELLLDVPVEYAEEAGRVLQECLVGCDDGALATGLAADIEVYSESWAESVGGFKPSDLPRTFR